MKKNVLSLRERYDDLSGRLSAPDALKNQEEYRKNAREHARVRKQLEAGEAWLALDQQVNDNHALLKSEKDPDMVAMVREELAPARNRIWYRLAAPPAKSLIMVSWLPTPSSGRSSFAKCRTPRTRRRA